MKAILCLFIAAFSAVFAGSVTLTNDSQYLLKAYVQGADGSYLGTMTVKPGVTTEWTNDYDFSPENEDPSRSQTPYTVSWTCMDESSFSSWSEVPEGGMVNALGGEGPRVCQSSKKSQPNMPQSPATNFPQPQSTPEY